MKNQETLAPDGLDAASSLNNLGIVVRNRVDLGPAEVCHKRALATHEKLAPDSLSLAGKNHVALPIFLS